MEDKIKSILKAKGLRMSDLAQKLGMGQSNLVASIRNNPKLSTLGDIANALGIKVGDLFDSGNRSDFSGFSVINGETYYLRKAHSSDVQVPVYTDYSKLKEIIKEFVVGSIKKQRVDSICGIVENIEMFNLTYDGISKAFFLSLCYRNKEMYTIRYDMLEYGDESGWAIEDILPEITNDVTDCVLSKLGL